MAELKTKLTQASARDFLALADIMEKTTKAKPKMWGSNIVGFGAYRYKYSDGREMEWMEIAFSPRKNYIALYVKPGFDGYDELMASLGKCSGSKSCVNIKRLSDVHMPTLKKLVQGSVAHVRKASKAR
jgi:hypothetical protein